MTIYLTGMILTGAFLGLAPIDKGNHAHITAAVLSAALWPAAWAMLIVGYLREVKR